MNLILLLAYDFDASPKVFFYFMKLFTCQQCGQLLYFENTHCESCGSSLGFLAHDRHLHTLRTQEEGLFSLFHDETKRYRYCENANYQACNWLVSDQQKNPFCLACDLNRTIPNLQEEVNILHWRKLELAKHRLVYALLRFHLPLLSKTKEPETGLAFDFLADQKLPSGKVVSVLTGHAQGLITLNIAEADDAERAKRRLAMKEPYRTLLGHFRHEVGHYYWDQLVAGSSHLLMYRQLFGDEREDYGEALQRHYRQGPPSDWSGNYISAYASAHSWEDWAETWAHYLHMIDTLETAHAFGMRIEPEIAKDESLIAEMDRDPYRLRNFDSIMAMWLPLTFAMNSINRSMGQPDLYPFVIAPPVVEKLRFVHQVCLLSKISTPVLV